MAHSIPSFGTKASDDIGGLGGSNSGAGAVMLVATVTAFGREKPLEDFVDAALSIDGS